MSSQVQRSSFSDGPPSRRGPSKAPPVRPPFESAGLGRFDPGAQQEKQRQGESQSRVRASHARVTGGKRQRFRMPGFWCVLCCVERTDARGWLETLADRQMAALLEIGPV